MSGHFRRSKFSDIYHARPDEDDPSYVIYDEDEFNSGLQNKNRKNESEIQTARPPFRVPSQAPVFGPPPQNVSLLDFIYQVRFCDHMFPIFVLFSRC